ncbi:MAG: RIP metalloprotease RseP [Deltaproteobacteria bacterium]|nr:RIP metalloprotease RseP [Deltaproteobacteria bacterium]
MAPWSYQPVIGFDLKNSILSKLGFMIGDKILSINGHKVETFSQISGQLKVLSGAILKAEIQRGLKTLEVSGQLPRAENLSVNPAFVIQSVGKNKPAAVAGLKEGDVLVSLNGKSVYEAKPTLEDVVKGIEESLKVMGQVQVGFVRSGEFKEVSVSGVQAPLPNGQMKYIIGIATGYLQNEPMVAKWRAGGIFASLSYSLETTIEWTLSILKTLKMLIFGQLSPKVLGGPIAIGAMAGERFKQGASYFLDIMAFISINLGVINFIPLPIFDGGHFLFFTIEAIRRKPIGEMGTRIANIVGIVLIVSLLVFVFYVDIARILGV